MGFGVWGLGFLGFGVWGLGFPGGSEYPNRKDLNLGPQIHTLNGFRTLKPHYLGTWTLRVLSFQHKGLGFRASRSCVKVLPRDSLLPCFLLNSLRTNNGSPRTK